MLVIDEDRLLETLEDLSPSFFETLIDYCEITSGVIPGRSRPQKERAKALIYYYQETVSSLDKLYKLVYRLTNLNVMIEKNDDYGEYDESY